MNYLVIDIESTCDDNDAFTKEMMEVIELGAVLINSDLDLIGEFNSFVKPVIRTKLTDFCTKLTTIKQSDVDAAPSLEEALQSLFDFCDEHGEFTFLSWGGFYYRQIKREAISKNINNPMIGKNINYKENYKKLTGRKARELGNTVKDLGLTFEGTAHRGIDDAKNIYQIIKKIGI